MQTLTIRIPTRMVKKLEHLAKKTGRTKSHYVRELMNENFDEMADAKLADQVWEDQLSGAPFHTSDEVKRMLGVR